MIKSTHYRLIRAGAWLLTVVVVAGLGMFAAAPGKSQTFDSLDLSGQELFERYCAACHGPNGFGNGPVAATMNKPVPNLTRLAATRNGEFPAQYVREAIDGRSMAIAHGTRQMPVWGYEFWVEEGADIVAESTAREMINRIVLYLESVQNSTEIRGFE